MILIVDRNNLVVIGKFPFNYFRNQIDIAKCKSNQIFTEANFNFIFSIAKQFD